MPAKNKCILVFALILSIAFSLFACTGPLAEKASSLSKTGTAAGKAAASNEKPGTKKPGMLPAYDPQITMTVGRSIDDGNKFADGEDFNDNKWRNYMVAHTGVDSDVIWAVPQGQYDQKVNVVIASGDIPDLMKVNGSQLQALAEAGMIQEMGTSIEKWQSDKLKSTIAGDPAAMKSATINGKVMALPMPGSTAMNYVFLNYRADWFARLGLNVPSTADELLEAAQAFARENPDSSRQTFGLGITKGLFGSPNTVGGFANLEGFFSMYHTYPTIWVRDDKGNAVWGGIQPEVKPVLLKLQEMYKEGLLDADFAVKDSDQVAEDLVNGKIGMEFSPWYGPYWPLNTAVAKNPKADWKVELLPTSDGRPALSPGQFPTQGYWVVRKGYKNPEALVRIVDFLLDYNFVNLKSYDWNVYEDPIAKAGVTWWVQGTIWFEPPTKNADICINEYLAAWNKHVNSPGAALTDNEKGDVANLDIWNVRKEPAGWPNWAAFGPGGTLDLTGSRIMKAPGSYILQNLYNTIPTQAMTDMLPALYNLQIQTYTQIIMGEPISVFDSFSEQWKKAGGDQITQNVNDWYHSN